MGHTFTMGRPVIVYNNVPALNKWHYIWLFAQKALLADVITVWRETHACSINGSIMAQVNLAIFTRSPNHQIKIIVNISAYTVICVWDGLTYGFNMKGTF